MLTQTSVLALLGAASAVTPGPVPASNTYPAFATPVPPAGTEIGTNTEVLAAYSLFSTNSVGIIRGFRNGLNVFPTQSITPAAAATTKAAVASPVAPVRTFWQKDVASLGSYA